MYLFSGIKHGLLNVSVFKMVIFMSFYIGIPCGNESVNECKIFKIHLLGFIADLPGKTVILLHKLFNGLFGCMVCTRFAC